jgi:hypothetical protein
MLYVCICVMRRYCQITTLYVLCLCVTRVYVRMCVCSIVFVCVMCLLRCVCACVSVCECVCVPLCSLQAQAEAGKRQTCVRSRLSLVWKSMHLKLHYI